MESSIGLRRGRCPHLPRRAQLAGFFFGAPAARGVAGLCPYVFSACKTNSAAAPRSAPAAACGHTVCAVAQSAPPSYFAGRGRGPDPPLPELPPDRHPESPPSAPQITFPPAPSAAAPNLPAAATSRCLRSPTPFRGATLPVPAPALPSRTPCAPESSLVRASPHSHAGRPQSAPLQPPAPAQMFRCRSRRPPLPSYLPQPPARLANNTPGCSLFLISKDADHIYRKHRQSRG